MECVCCTAHLKHTDTSGAVQVGGSGAQPSAGRPPLSSTCGREDSAAAAAVRQLRRGHPRPIPAQGPHAHTQAHAHTHTNIRPSFIQFSGCTCNKHFCVCARRRWTSSTGIWAAWSAPCAGLHCASKAAATWRTNKSTASWTTSGKTKTKQNYRMTFYCGA